MTVASNTSVLALDVGASRVGVAIASNVARLASPLMTLSNPETFYADIQHIVAAENVGQIVVGYPRSLSGDPTSQTEAVEAFVEALQQAVTVPIALQDEAVTSRKAEAELIARGKPYEKGDIDALAATYILEDYLRDNPGERA